MGNLCCLVSILLETSTHHMQVCLDSSWCTSWWAVMVIFRTKCWICWSEQRVNKLSISGIDSCYPQTSWYLEGSDERQAAKHTSGSSHQAMVKWRVCRMHGYWRPKAPIRKICKVIYIYIITDMYSDIWIFWMYFECSIPEMLGKHLVPGRSQVVQRFGMPKFLIEKNAMDFIVYLGQEV